MTDLYTNIKYGPDHEIKVYVDNLQKKGIDAKMGISPFWGWSHVYVRESQKVRALRELYRLP